MAFIAPTYEPWWDYHINKSRVDETHTTVVFWTNCPISCLKKGNKFLFLGGIRSKERYIEGYGLFEKRGRCKIAKLWEEYRNKCGAGSLEELKLDIEGTFPSMEPVGDSDPINYLVITPFTEFKKKVYPRKEGLVEYFPGNVKFGVRLTIGKKISEEEAEEIIKKGMDD